MKVLQRFIKGDMHGIHYAVSIFIATAVLWLLVHELAETNPVWAISSMVATSDPLMKQALLFLRSRIINTLVGCAVGLLFIAIGGTKLITLPLAMAGPCAVILVKFHPRNLAQRESNAAEEQLCQPSH